MRTRPHGETATGPVGPIAPGDRQPILDVLRGFAVLGILLVNIEYMRGADLYLLMAGTSPPSRGTLDGVAAFAIGWLVSGKFLASFALLFGVGTALMVERASGSSRDPRRMLRRRYLALLVFGLTHMLLLFPGDILFVYGLTGLVLLLFVRLAADRLAWWSGGLLGATVVASAGLGAWSAWLGPPPPDDPVAAAMTGFLAERRVAAIEAFTTGGYGDVVTAHLWEATLIQAGQLLVLPWILGLFLLGSAVGKSGVVADPGRYARQLRLTAAIGLGAGLPLNLVLGRLGPMAMGSVLSRTEDPAVLAMLSAIGITLGAPLLAVGYLSALTLLCLRIGPLGSLASAGRVALSAYLLQSVLALAVFAGFGLYDRVSTLQALGITIGIWGVVLFAASRWSRHFRFGPVEWLWRAVTYRHWPSIR
jgi:uncharacterized protein